MAATSTISEEAKKRLVYGSDDALFGAVERQQDSKPFGSILDAGTGMHSLRWMATLSPKGMTSFTAITADATMQRNVQSEADALGISPEVGKIVIGNWFDQSNYDPEEKSTTTTTASFSLNEQFDTILVDYLIGAMDGFSPYKQDQILSQLANNYLKPGGRMYIVGLEPVPDTVDGPAQIMCRVRQVRDACILLAGHRCYREYPLEWIERQCDQIPNLVRISSRKFPILYRHRTIVRQINVARNKLDLISSKCNPVLKQGMKAELDSLEQQSLEATEKSSTGALKLGFDYMVTVEKES